MTRKHFNALAEELYACRPARESTSEAATQYKGWWEAVCCVADACEYTNDRFSRSKFLRACEIGV